MSKADIRSVSRSGAAASTPQLKGITHAGTACVMLSDRKAASESPAPTTKWEIADAMERPGGGTGRVLLKPGSILLVGNQTVEDRKNLLTVFVYPSQIIAEYRLEIVSFHPLL